MSLESGARSRSPRGSFGGAHTAPPTPADAHARRAESRALLVQYSVATGVSGDDDRTFPRASGCAPGVTFSKSRCAPKVRARDAPAHPSPPPARLQPASSPPHPACPPADPASHAHDLVERAAPPAVQAPLPWVHFEHDRRAVVHVAAARKLVALELAHEGVRLRLDDPLRRRRALRSRVAATRGGHAWRSLGGR